MESNTILLREKRARRKACELGYKVHKGFQHYMYNNAVCRDINGNAYVGYMVEDMNTGFYVYDSYDNNYDHRWTLEDVENFLNEESEKAV